MLPHDLFCAQIFLDSAVNDGVEHLIGRQAVLVGLIRAELGRGSLVQAGLGNDFLFTIDGARQLVDHRLRHVGNDGEASGHVAVERAVAGRQLRFVPGTQQQRAEFIRKRHEDVAANPGLDVLFGDVARQIAKDRLQRAEIRLEKRRDRYHMELNAQVRRQGLGIAETLLGRIRSRHGDAQNVFRAQRVRRQRGNDGGVDPSAQPDDPLLEPALSYIVPRPQNQRLMHGFDLGGGAGPQLLVALRIENHQVFRKRAGARSNSSFRIKRQARTVKDQAVVAAHLIYVDDRQPVFDGNPPQHLLPQERLFDGKR